MASDGLVLIDTSAWVYALRKGVPHRVADAVKQVVLEHRGATTGMVLLELLGGARMEPEYRELLEELRALHLLPVDQAWPRAWRLSFDLRRHGVTVPSADVLIAAVAIEHESALLHADEHFTLIARHSRLNAQEIRAH